MVSGGAFQGNWIFIPRIKMRPTDGTYSFDLTQKQFPVCRSLGITLKKSQGQTLETVGLYIDCQFFSYTGIIMFYFAKNGLRILVTDE
jgi:ATP-dependent DNA helicase PIF1